jgi:hypothetical protein
MASQPFFRNFVGRTALIEPMERIADRMHAYAESGVTTLSVTPHAPTQTDRTKTPRRVVSVPEAEDLRS